VALLREKGEVAPIIMLSANIGDGTRPDTLPDNAHNDTLTKPFDIRQIHAKLAVHLGFEWVYEQVEENKSARRPTVIDSPALSDLHDLIRLGEIGYVRGIEAKLTLLAHDENLIPFVDKARDYIRAFNMSGYDMFLRNLEQKLDDQP